MIFLTITCSQQNNELYLNRARFLDGVEQRIESRRRQTAPDLRGSAV